MSNFYEDEEIPLLLVRRAKRGPEDAHLERDKVTRAQDRETTWTQDSYAMRDRMRPFTAGGIMGFLAGASGLGVVHAMVPALVLREVAKAAQTWGVTTSIGLAVAYVTVGSCGALLGACFAAVTRYLRRFVPLLLWALVFFVSVAMLVLSLVRTYAHGAGASLAPSILTAAAAYAIIVSFELPLRMRSRSEWEPEVS
ncbi:hypothetical protein AKJ09_02795 [Labilithrix luteola]|uniref:Uncharacterized protein n=1 Tax=Labilithrix luteola TaxID=1391654 RepID=A0A0K1PRW5_9BACT|nr:hypothetical protein [Labilithrix luteola]AKU96131.1 hypothetical protein AKJ09_02795 [Labilithrix luteola]